MKIIIYGREYEAVNYKTASVLHLMELRQQSREFTDDGKGLGLKALEQMQRRGAAHQREIERAQAEGLDVAEVESPDDADLWLAVCLFLCRREAGEKLRFLEAVDVPMGDIEVVPEPGDETPGQEPDPQQPGSGGPATPAPEDAPTTT